MQIKTALLAAGLSAAALVSGQVYASSWGPWGGGGDNWTPWSSGGNRGPWGGGNRGPWNGGNEGWGFNSRNWAPGGGNRWGGNRWGGGDHRVYPWSRDRMWDDLPWAGNRPWDDSDMHMPWSKRDHKNWQRMPPPGYWGRPPQGRPMPPPPGRGPAPQAAPPASSSGSGSN